MLERHGIPFAELTTLRVGGPANRLVEVETEGEVCDFVARFDRSAQPGAPDLGLLVLGGGSNLVVSDIGFAGTTLAIRTMGRAVAVLGADTVLVTVAAGEPWDEVVAWSLAEGFAGLETLGGIPGRTGATPIQNVGAYGTELGDVLEMVRVWDRARGEIVTLTVSECGLGYRTSRFKRHPADVIVIDVTLRLARDDLSRPVRYAELAKRLDVEPGSTLPTAEVARAVLELRRAKAMLLDPADHDTWSAGSFFTNPIVTAAVAGPLPPEVARWPATEGRVKVSAAALLEAAGFGRGYGGSGGQVAGGGAGWAGGWAGSVTGRATVSGRHSLAITNRGSATAADIVALARVLRDGVRSRFGITLEPEPTLIGVEL